MEEEERGIGKGKGLIREVREEEREGGREGGREGELSPVPRKSTSCSTQRRGSELLTTHTFSTTICEIL